MSVRDPLIYETWEIGDIPDYFPRLRTDGAALFRLLAAATIEQACLLLLQDRYRDAMRSHGELWHKAALRRGKGAPRKPVVDLFRAAGLRLVQAREAAALLHACLADANREPEPVAPFIVEAREKRQRWQELTDLLVRARLQLRAEGETRATPEQVRALIMAHPQAYPVLRRSGKRNGWEASAQFVWQEITRLGLHNRSITALQRGRNKPDKK
jgi:hypothetical protein